ncbi:MAG: MFS transporter [Gammaproteobacteria bacterium]|nr:MFS transporter [Gammaproteobacteria bacterium]
MNSTLARIDHAIRPRGHVFHGWWIATGAAGIQFLSGVLWMQSFGAYNALLQADFGWSSAVIGGAFALTRVESGLLGPLQGWLVDRFGPRLILRIGLVVFAAGFVLFGFINTILMFYLAFALIALGSSLGGFATLMVPIVNWFNRHRSKAVAVSQLGYSFGGLCVPVVVVSLELFGWRATAIGSGVVILLVGLPFVQLVHHRPAAKGEVPDGIAEPAHAITSHGHAGPDFTPTEAIRTRAFWFMSIGHALALLTVSTVMVHLVPHLAAEDGLDFSLGQAGWIVALMTACQMVGQLLGGWLGDHMEKRLVCVGCMIAHGTGLLVLAFASNLAMVVAFAALHGLGWGVRGPLMVALRADYFGATSFGTIMGLSSLIVMLGMMVGPVVAGFMADLSGNHVAGFAMLACGSLLGAFLFAAATPPPPPTRHSASHA